MVLVFRRRLYSHARARGPSSTTSTAESVRREDAVSESTGETKTATRGRKITTDETCSGVGGVGSEDLLVLEVCVHITDNRALVCVRIVLAYSFDCMTSLSCSVLLPLLAVRHSG